MPPPLKTWSCTMWWDEERPKKTLQMDRNTNPIKNKKPRCTSVLDIPSLIIKEFLREGLLVFLRTTPRVSMLQENHSRNLSSRLACMCANTQIHRMLQRQASYWAHCSAKPTSHEHTSFWAYVR